MSVKKVIKKKKKSFKQRLHRKKGIAVPRVVVARPIERGGAAVIGTTLGFC